MPKTPSAERTSEQRSNTDDSPIALPVYSLAEPNSSAPQESFIKFILRNVAELGRVKFGLSTFVVNTLRRRYHNSILGFAWSLLNPMLTMGVMALVFSLIFHQDPKKFSVYLFGAMLPWNFIVEALVNGSTSIISYESFLKKLYLPKTFFPLVTVSLAAANFTFSMSSLLLLAFFFGMKPSASLLLLPLATAVLFLFNFGLALILAVGTLYLRDLTHIVTVILGVLFYTMPIIYPVDQMPEQYRALFLWNPFYYFLCLFRALLYEARMPSLQEWAVVSAIAAVSILASFYVLRKKEKDIIYRL